MVLKVICAWCRDTITEGDPVVIDGVERVSHGMCEECYKKETKKLPNAKKNEGKE